jgi:hypothetical protein
MSPGSATGRERAPERKRVARRRSLEKEGISREVSVSLRSRVEEWLTG